MEFPTKDKKYIQLREMQRYALNYIPFFSFCITTAKSAGFFGQKSSFTGHICSTYIPIPHFYSRLKNTKLKKLIKEQRNDVLGLSEGELKKYKVLIGEGTAIVRPYIKNKKYQHIDGKLKKYLNGILNINTTVKYKKVTDYVQMRQISDPNEKFYSQFGLLFTPFFYDMGANIYGFICATKSKKGKPYYGIRFHDFLSLSTSVEFYTQPPIKKQFLKICKKNWRYIVPLPVMKKNKDSFEEIHENKKKFYTYDYGNTFFKELKTHERDEKYIKYVVGYGWLTDEEIFNTNIQFKLKKYIKDKNVRIIYKRQQLAQDTCTHFFLFFKPVSYEKIK
jgi:hypothetical protein